MRTFLSLFLCFFLLASQGCRKVVSKEELGIYISNPENGLVLNKAVNGYKLTVNYYPKDLIIDRELNSYENPLNSKLVEDQHNDTWYFHLAISDNGGEVLNRFARNPEQFRQMSQRLNFEMEHYIYFKSPLQDTIPVISAALVPTYGVSDHTRLILSLKSEDLLKNDWLEMVVGEFGLKLGEQHFRFDTDQLKNTPRLLFKKEKNEQDQAFN